MYTVKDIRLRILLNYFTFELKNEKPTPNLILSQALILFQIERIRKSKKYIFLLLLLLQYF